MYLEPKVIEIILSSNTIIADKEIENLRKLFQDKFKDLNVIVKIRYTEYSSLEDILEKYWLNIIVFN